MRFSGYTVLYVTSVSLLALDQATKYWVTHLSGLKIGDFWPFGGIEIVAGVFYIAHLGNTGAAWGFFEGFNNILAILAVAALFAIYYFRKDLSLENKTRQFIFGLLCGGIAGNLVDRIFLKHVVDFLDFYLLGGFRWPTFNLADSGITVGVVLFIIHSIFLENPQE